MIRLLLKATEETSSSLPPPLAKATVSALVADLSKLGIAVEPATSTSPVDAVLIDTEEPGVDLAMRVLREKQTPTILTSALRPTGPWFLDIDPEARIALIDPWNADLERRKKRALDLCADAYADSAESIAEAARTLLATDDSSTAGPSLCYRGALFNTLAVPIGSCFELPVGKDAILGRGKGVTILTHSAQIARHHLRLHLRPEGSVEVTDLGGSNGNWLCRAGLPAEQLPQGGRPIDLEHGDELAIAGDFRMQYLRG